MDTIRAIALMVTATLALLTYAERTHAQTMVCGNQVIEHSRIPARCAEFKRNVQCKKLRQCMKRHRPSGKPGNRTSNIMTLPGEAPHNSTREGDTVNFECKIFNANQSDYHLSWYRNDEILFSGNQMVPPMTRNESVRYRVQIAENNTHVLTIFDIARDIDEGLYACKFNVGGTKGYQHSFRLNILYIPDITGISVDRTTPNPSVHRPDPSSDVLVFNETRNALLRCETTGNPTPLVNWSREGSPLPEDRVVVRGDLLLIKNLTRHDTGRYQCHAYNELGAVSSDYVIVQVQYPPVMTIPEPHETGGRSKSVLLDCYVYAQPPATKRWMKDGRPVRLDRNGNRIYIANDENSTKMHILQLNPAVDYGNYTCHAENMLGTVDGFIDLNGLPTEPEIFSKNFSSHRNSYTLRWSYRHTQDDNRIHYFTYCYIRRQIYITGKRTILDNPNAPCFNVTVPEHSTERIFSSRLTDLFPNANYLLELYAVNKYGRGDVTEHTFRTAEVDITSTPSTCTFHVGDQGYVIGPGGNTAVPTTPMSHHLLTSMLVITILYHLLNK